MNKISGDLSYLYQRPAAQVQLATTQSIATGSVTALTFATAYAFNTGVTTFPTRSGTSSSIVVPEAGVYSVMGYIQYAVVGGGTEREAILQGGSAAANGAPPGTNNVTVSDILNLAASATVTLSAYQDSGGSINVTSAWLTVVRIA